MSRDISTTTTVPLERQPVLELGSGRISAAGVGPKAHLLDRAAASGLAVPAGCVIVDSTEPERIPDLPGPLAVRSAFSTEDRTTASSAGLYETVLDVPSSASAIADAVGRVRASAHRRPEADHGGPLRLDVIVMQQVDAVTSGVAFTEQQYEDDLVEVTSGLADRLVGGQVAGDRVDLPKLRRWERPAPSLPPWARRLSRLLVDVRRVFGDRDWDVEWADDGSTCWLVQLRPITASPVRNEAFTIANHKEILPDLPSTLMTSVISAGAPHLLRFWSDADPTLPVQRPFVETFLGRPYLNLSMLTDLMRALGLPTRLVTDSYGGEPDIDIGLRPIRVISKTPTLLRIARSQVAAVQSAESAGRAVEAARPDGPGFGPALDTLVHQYVTLVSEMSSLAASLAPPTALLKMLGTLEHHLVNHRTAATKMLDDLGPIRDAITAGLEPGDPDFDRAWAEWVADHGHRGVFESDIARPRFRDDPAPIIAAARTTTAAVTTPSRRWRQMLTAPIWLLVKRSMTAREDLRHRSMRGFSATRDRLVELARASVNAGRLPDVDAVWDLTCDELRSVDAGTVFTPDDLERRRRERQRLARRQLPDSVRRFDDLERVRSSTERSRVFHGQPLVKGTVVGRALRASEPPPGLPAGFEPSTTILVARSVDAGWVPVFGQVAGVAVEIGGDLSHGSIVLRELGIPSVTNLGAIGDAIRTGDTVELRASAGAIETLTDSQDSARGHAAGPREAGRDA